MARKAFIADVAAECNKSIPNIRDVHIGDGGEELVFTFTTCSGQQLLIRALATGVLHALVSTMNANYCCSPRSLGYSPWAAMPYHDLCSLSFLSVPYLTDPLY